MNMTKIIFNVEELGDCVILCDADASLYLQINL